MAAVSRSTWNVRFENIGHAPVSSTGSAAAHLAYRWRNAAGQLLDHGLLTPLPVAVAPGREITVPMLVDTPIEPGRYSLSIGLAVKGGVFVDLRTAPVEIYLPDLTALDRVAYASLRAGALLCGPQTRILKMLQARIASSTSAIRAGRTVGWNHRMLELEYDADHLDAIQSAMRHVQGLGVARPRILEIGGNACPMIRDFRGELYNVDVDVHGMQVGYLTNRECDGSIRFYVADANALPFPDGFFDVILIFSSVHHMPDPRASLRHYARKLKSDGLIGVLCEPIGHYYGDDIDPSLLKELQKGLNEQTFSLEEWAAIFEGAGLCEREVIVDQGSLKAFLGRYF